MSKNTNKSFWDDFLDGGKFHACSKRCFQLSGMNYVLQIFLGICEYRLNGPLQVEQFVITDIVQSIVSSVFQ